MTSKKQSSVLLSTDDLMVKNQENNKKLVFYLDKIMGKSYKDLEFIRKYTPTNTKTPQKANLCILGKSPINSNHISEYKNHNKRNKSMIENIYENTSHLKSKYIEQNNSCINTACKNQSIFHNYASAIKLKNKSNFPSKPSIPPQKFKPNSSYSSFEYPIKNQTVESFKFENLFNELNKIYACQTKNAQNVNNKWKSSSMSSLGISNENKKNLNKTYFLEHLPQNIKNRSRMSKICFNKNKSFAQTSFNSNYNTNSFLTNSSPYINKNKKFTKNHCKTKNILGISQLIIESKRSKIIQKLLSSTKPDEEILNNFTQNPQKIRTTTKPQETFNIKPIPKSENDLTDCIQFKINIQIKRKNKN